MDIINNSESSYFICYNQYAEEPIRFAAQELQKYLYEATDCLLPMFSNKCERRSKELHIGSNVRNDKYNKISKELKLEEFQIIKSEDSDGVSELDEPVDTVSPIPIPRFSI